MAVSKQITISEELNEIIERERDRDRHFNLSKTVEDLLIAYFGRIKKGEKAVNRSKALNAILSKGSLSISDLLFLRENYPEEFQKVVNK